MKVLTPIIAFGVVVNAVPAAVKVERLRSRQDTELPVVDLGYELHQASSYNATGHYYNFSNIRFAAPPTGNNRWRVPQPPETDRSTVHNGSIGRICPQANPVWTYGQTDFVQRYLLGQPFNASIYTAISVNQTLFNTIPVQDPRTTEDCLFLDVFVPDDVFHNDGNRKLAPVLVWIYGGGYTGGWKSLYGPSNGLIARSQDAPTTGGLIYVTFNYRLGSLGWLSGKAIEADGTANAGLYDQRFALMWVKKYIHLFGGDCSQVTLMGESAGGGSVIHQITAFGGKKGKVPFQRAIPQSPGWQISITPCRQEKNFRRFLELANVSSLEEARQADTETIMKAAIRQVQESPYGAYTFSPTIDGNIVPDFPGKSFAEGNFDQSLKIMVGHNADEGLFFTPPATKDDSGIYDYLSYSIENASDQDKDYIMQVLYPPIFDGSQGYTDNIGRASKIVAEYAFTCNTFYADTAFKNQTYSYKFNILPALHGQDVYYTYFTGNNATPNAVPANHNPLNLTTFVNVTNVTTAIALQEFITSFVQTGMPVSNVQDGIPDFLNWGNAADKRAMMLNEGNITIGVDDVNNDRCRWWQKGSWLG